MKFLCFDDRFDEMFSQKPQDLRGKIQTLNMKQPSHLGENHARITSRSFMTMAAMINYPRRFADSFERYELISL